MVIHFNKGITLKTEFLGEIVNWETALAMLVGDPEADCNWLQYKEDGLYCLDVEEQDAVNAVIDRVTIKFNSLLEHWDACNKLAALNAWFQAWEGEPSRGVRSRLTTFRTYALQAGLNVEPDK